MSSVMHPAVGMKGDAFGKTARYEMHLKSSTCTTSLENLFFCLVERELEDLGTRSAKTQNTLERRPLISAWLLLFVLL